MAVRADRTTRARLRARREGGEATADETPSDRALVRSRLGQPSRHRAGRRARWTTSPAWPDPLPNAKDRSAPCNKAALSCAPTDRPTGRSRARPATSPTSTPPLARPLAGSLAPLLRAAGQPSLERGDVPSHRATLRSWRTGGHPSREPSTSSWLSAGWLAGWQPSGGGRAGGAPRKWKRPRQQQLTATTTDSSLPPSPADEVSPPPSP